MGQSEPTRNLALKLVRGLTGTVRQITATHRMDKLHQLSAIKY